MKDFKSKNGFFTGNVGIGTTNSGSKLEVLQELEANDVGDSILTVTNTRLNTGSSSATIGFVTDEVDGSTADKRAQISASYDGTNGGKLVLSTHNGTSLNQALTIKNDGNIGIGTTNPGSKLEIYSNSGVGNTQIHIHNDSTGNAAVLRLEGGRNTTDSNTYQDVGQVLFANKGNITAGIRSYHQGDGQSSDNDFDDGDLRFLTSDHGSSNVLSTRMVINKGGNVGIGTTNPSDFISYASNLVVGDGASPAGISIHSNSNHYGALVFADGKTGDEQLRPGQIVYDHSTNSMFFNANRVECMRITSDGNVGMGTTSPTYELEVESSSPVIGVTSTTSGAPEFRLENTLKSWSNYVDTAGNLVWLNRSDSNETMRITSGGNVGIGTTNPTKVITAKRNGDTAHLSFESTGMDSKSNWSNYLIVTTTTGTSNPTGNSGSWDSVIGVYRPSTNVDFAGTIRLTDRNKNGRYLWFNTSGTLRTSNALSNVGSPSGGIAVGEQTSDERLKDIAPSFDYGLEQVMQLKPIDYKFKDDENETRHLGFGAQSTRDIIPEVVYDTQECIDGYDADPEDEDKQIARSEDTKLAMKYVELVPVLTKAIQEQQQIIEDLKSRIETLES